MKIDLVKRAISEYLRRQSGAAKTTHRFGVGGDGSGGVGDDGTGGGGDDGGGGGGGEGSGSDGYVGRTVRVLDYLPKRVSVGTESGVQGSDKVNKKKQEKVVSLLQHKSQQTGKGLCLSLTLSRFLSLCLSVFVSLSLSLALSLSLSLSLSHYVGYSRCSAIASPGQAAQPHPRRPQLRGSGLHRQHRWHVQRIRARQAILLTLRIVAKSYLGDGKVKKVSSKKKKFFLGKILKMKGL